MTDATTSDPILAAITGRDAACPDGAAMEQLGAAVRAVATPPAPVDLLAAVRAGCTAAASNADAADSTDAGEAALIDDLYDGESQAAAAADPQLASLGALVRDAATPDDEVDLLPRLEGRFHDRETSRRLHAQAERATRWRIWTAVVGGHVAALFALAVFRLEFVPKEIGDGESVMHAPGADAGLYRIDLEALLSAADEQHAGLATNWAAHAQEATSLVRTRRDPALRERTRNLFRLNGSQPTVTAGLTWLQRRYQRETHLVGGSADVEVVLLRQASVAAALLGEGHGDADRESISLAVLEWLTQQDPMTADPTTAGVVALSLIDARQVLDDERWGQAAAVWLTRAATVEQAWTGITLLAAAQAEVAGVAVPPPLTAELRRLRQMGVAEVFNLTGDRFAAAALVRRVAGVATPGASARLVAMLAEESVTVDPQTWFLASLYQREAEPVMWRTWAASLQGRLLAECRFTAEGEAWLPHLSDRRSHDTATSTAWLLLALQAGYRYVPLLS